jgi:hypothetical protein
MSRILLSYFKLCNLFWILFFYYFRKFCSNILSKTAHRIFREFYSWNKERCSPFFVLYVVSVKPVSCPRKSFQRGNKDTLYERRFFVEYLGQSVTKLHACSNKTNAAIKKYGTRLKQRHLREWYIPHVLFQRIEREEKYDTDERTRNKGHFCRGNRCKKLNFRDCHRKRIKFMLNVAFIPHVLWFL